MKDKIKNIAEKLEHQIRMHELDLNDRIKDIPQIILLLEQGFSELKEIVSFYKFKSEMDEIFFFKIIKPKFFSKLIYYRKVYNIEMMRPNGQDCVLKNYFINELNQLENFYNKNIDFYKYYRSGSTHLDKYFFLRGKQDIQMTMETFYFERDPNFSTICDFKVAKIVANEMLRIYLNLYSISLFNTILERPCEELFSMNLLFRLNFNFMVKFNLLFALLITPLVCFGQNAYDYYGEKVQLEAHYFQSQNAGKLKGDKKLSYQGMDISNGYAVSAQSTGVITVYDLNGGDMSKEKQLKLSTFSKTANAYNVSFGTKKMTEEDVLPLLYVSGNHGVLNVEQIEKKFKNVNAVQTITLDAKFSKIDWAVDADNGFLYAFCTNKNGTHQIMRFNVPEVKEGEVSTVKLKTSDALDNYLVEKYYQGKAMTSTHGVYVHDGQLYITSGNGTPNDASRLYVWDLCGKMLRNVIDLSTATRDELKACSVHNGALYVQTQSSMYKLIF